MQDLHCRACDSRVPLHAPALVAGRWQAICGECLTINCLAPESRNVFLPLRFRVECVVGDHPRSVVPPQPARPER